ncbi:hypothetical protein CEXT_719741 [Caerostris extrusa]|uniref:Uncharacterized protein n=1 Tax=Caerostris extrusa TaxID=172846 RepID=A0AAV4W2E5_CAEEX|nr:hypothetical protein CEXT_719741 [Caerostris extrusa]
MHRVVEYSRNFLKDPGTVFLSSKPPGKRLDLTWRKRSYFCGLDRLQEEESNSMPIQWSELTLWQRYGLEFRRSSFQQRRETALRLTKDLANILSD